MMVVVMIIVIMVKTKKSFADEYSRTACIAYCVDKNFPRLT
jgi:hypothetical protein